MLRSAWIERSLARKPRPRRHHSRPPEAVDGFREAWKARIALISRSSHGALPTRAKRLLNDRQLLLDILGGALVYRGGEASVHFTAAAMSLRTGRPVLGIDQRVSANHPLSAGLTV